MHKVATRPGESCNIAVTARKPLRAKTKPIPRAAGSGRQKHEKTNRGEKLCRPSRFERFRLQHEAVIAVPAVRR